MTWSDNDLREPYKFGTGIPKFKPGLLPDGQPRIYRTLVRLGQLKDNRIDNPWEWIINVDLPVMPEGHPSQFDPDFNGEREP